MTLQMEDGLTNGRLPCIYERLPNKWKISVTHKNKSYSVLWPHKALIWRNSEFLGKLNDVRNVHRYNDLPHRRNPCMTESKYITIPNSLRCFILITQIMRKKCQPALMERAAIF